jgi:acetyl-CoA carboxylase biotin carboxyl carrier protein
MKGPKDKKAPASFPMPGVNVEQLERLLDFMAAHGLEEFEYEHGGLHIRLRKSSSFAPPPLLATQGASQAAASVAAPAPAVSEGRHEAAAPAAAPVEDLHVVKSPIVGTFYSAPGPEAEAFVKVGSAVREGQVLCIVEAMKLMNEIESDASGEVVQVLAENGQPVEYGQPLFSIRVAKKKK